MKFGQTEKRKGSVNMKYKMIALDLDGTLTNSKKIITPETKRALFAYQKQGGRVILASGRPTPGIVPLAKELELEKYNGFILAFNGSRIQNCATGEVLFNQTLKIDEMAEIHRLTEKYHMNVLTYEGDVIYTENELDPYALLEQRITKMQMVQVPDISKAVKTPANKCLMTGEPEILIEVEKKVKEAMGDRIEVYRSQDFFLELVPQHVDKAASLDRLLETLKIKKEELIACGDGLNDLSMIQYAGLGVAMQNAHQDIQNVADYITLSNDEDGIAHVLEKFVFVAA